MSLSLATHMIVSLISFLDDWLDSLLSEIQERVKGNTIESV